MPGVLNGKVEAHELEVPTLEEALALAAAMCPEHEAFVVHEAHCEVSPEHPERCTCSPQVVVPVRAGRA